MKLKIKVNIEKRRIGNKFLYFVVSNDPTCNGIALGSTKEETIEILHSWNKLRHYDGYPQVELVD